MPAGHLAHQRLAAGHIADCRAAVADGYAEALAVADGDVGSPFAGSLQEGQRRGGACHDHQRLGAVDGVGEACEVFDDAVAVGLRQYHAGDVPLGELFLHVVKRGYAPIFGYLADDYSVVAGVGVENGAHGRKQSRADQNAVAAAGGGDTHHHGLGGGRSGVVHRGVADVEACQRRHHRLIFEDILQGALRDFGLIGGIGRGEFAARGQGGHDGRRIVVIETVAGEADGHHIVLGGQMLEEIGHFLLAKPLVESVFALQAKFGGHVGVEIVEALEPAAREHGVDVAGSVRKVLVHG